MVMRDMNAQVMAMSDDEQIGNILAGMLTFTKGEPTGQSIKEATEGLLQTGDWQDDASFLNELLESSCPEKVVIEFLKALGCERHLEALTLVLNGTKVSPEYIPDLVEAFEKNRSAANPLLFQCLLKGTIDGLKRQRAC